MIEQPYVTQLMTLVENVRDVLDSPDPVTRLRAVRHLTEGVEKIERCVATEAHDAGMTWAEIGTAYNVTRQSAHKRFAGLPVASNDVFEWLQSDEADEPSPALAAAARRESEIVQDKGRVPHGAAR